jgi:hypothetical protein
MRDGGWIVGGAREVNRSEELRLVKISWMLSFE